MLNTPHHRHQQILWTGALEIGHPEIDADHRAIVSLLNYLLAAAGSSDHVEVRALLRALEALTREHFRREERLMLDIHYELAARHQQEHLRLVDEIRAQVDELNDGSTSAAAIVHFITRWLMDHIQSADRQLALTLAQRQPSSSDWVWPGRPVVGK